MNKIDNCDVLVIGAGPGGYTAAFRAADLGLKVILLEKHAQLGGVCLNVGCIPSKTLLHAAEVITQAHEMAAQGVRFESPEIDIFKIGANRDAVIKKLTGGLAMLAKQRKITVIQGEGQFIDDHNVEVTTNDGAKTISFSNCIIAAGSRPMTIDNLPSDNPNLMDSTDALRLAEVPDNMLVIGGGIIGLEMARVYAALGVDITIVDRNKSLLREADQDLVKPLHQRLKRQYTALYLNTTVKEVKEVPEGLLVSFSGDKAPTPAVFDKVLVAVGRQPNGKLLGADKAGVAVDDAGFIRVDKQMRTNIQHIFAIGDIVGQPMLAHKATHEAKVAAEVIAGEKVEFSSLTIPSVAYTDPEVAWCGLTEKAAQEQGIEYDKGSFPWAASGRNLSLGRAEGLSKLLFDKRNGNLIGAGIVGANAGELIAEAVLAMEMGADAEDIGLTIHPHPTLSETLCFAAEMAAGTITDLLPTKSKK